VSPALGDLGWSWSGHQVHEDGVIAGLFDNRCDTLYFFANEPRWNRGGLSVHLGLSTGAAASPVAVENGRLATDRVGDRFTFARSASEQLATLGVMVPPALLARMVAEFVGGLPAHFPPPAGTAPDGDDGYELETLGNLKVRYAAEPAPLVAGYLELGALVLVPGPPDSFKSWAMLDLCRAVTVGGMWLDHFPVPKGTAVYIEQERARNLVYQASRIAQGNGCDLDALLVGPPAGMNLRDPAWADRLTRMVEHHQPTVVVINSFRSAFRGRAGDGSEIHEALGWLGTLAEQAKATIVLVDQLNKAGATGAVRGMAAHADSAQKEYEADAVLHIERDRDPVGRGTGPARLFVGKLRAGEAGPPFAFDVQDQAAGGVKLVYLGETQLDRPEPPQRTSAREKVLAALPTAGAKSIEAIASETGLAIPTVKNELAALKEAGRAINVERGRWRKIVLVVLDPRDKYDKYEYDDAEADTDTPCPLCGDDDLVPSLGGSGWVCAKLMPAPTPNGHVEEPDPDQIPF
jgi:hypothetical protein